MRWDEATAPGHYVPQRTPVRVVAHAGQGQPNFDLHQRLPDQGRPVWVAELAAGQITQINCADNPSAFIEIRHIDIGAPINLSLKAAVMVARRLCIIQSNPSSPEPPISYRIPS